MAKVTPRDGNCVEIFFRLTSEKKHKKGQVLKKDADANKWTVLLKKDIWEPCLQPSCRFIHDQARIGGGGATAR